MTRMKIFSLDVLSVTSICTIEMPKLDSLLQSWALIAVCGRPKGKTVHLKVKYRPKTKSKASLPGLFVPYLFEINKTNFTSCGNVNQIVASHSHDKLHLAFNQGNEILSFYDYTNVCVPKSERPDCSMFFPHKIQYASNTNTSKEISLATLSLPGESLKIIKEIEPGVWLIHLRRS